MDVWIGFAVGGALGALMLWLYHRAQISAQQEKLAWVERAEKTFEALAGRTLQSNLEFQNAQFKNLVDPLGKTLGDLSQEVRQLESKREGAYKSLEEQLRQLAGTHHQLQASTISLVQALKSSTARGQWGEMQLRRIVELAGLVEHVDFETQTTVEDGRPDLTVRLPNHGIVPVDAKAPMQAYLEAVEAADEPTRKAKMAQHAQAVRSRIVELGQKKYWQKFERAPEFVVMFVPNEACLAAAFQYDAQLLDYAMTQQVLVATPVTLLALLKAVAFGWQQHAVAENAQQIAKHAAELHRRLSVFLENFGKLGKGLNMSVSGYNEAVDSLRDRVLPQAQRLSGELPPPKPVENHAIERDA